VSIGNELELKIVSIFNRDITGMYSINQISKILKKAYPHINKKVNDLISENVLKKIVIGRSYLCSINLNNEKAIVLLTLNKINEKDGFIKKNKKIKSIVKDIKKIRLNYKVHTIFSYDTKLFFVLDYKNDDESILSNHPEIKNQDPNFLSVENFYEKILEDKSLIQDSIIMYSHEKYFELIQNIEDKLFLRGSLFSNNN
jgi:hypothetical protein